MNKWTVRRWLSVWLVAGSTGATAAQMPPAPFPAPAVEAPIEVYYGANRVTPLPPAPPDHAAVIPAAAVNEATDTRSADTFREALGSVRDGTRDITAATVGLLGKVGDRVKRTADVRPIIVATYSQPAPPAPVAAAVPLAPPQVVVVRQSEPQPQPQPVAAAPAGWNLQPETMIALGVGTLGLIVAGVALLRGSRQPLPANLAFARAAAAPFDPNAVQLQGGYNAGPQREPAEKFDIGPTYHDELHQKKQMEEANNAAAVEFILLQNLAFLAELNPDAGGAIVHTDEEGFAAPVLG